jgi:hypothetical protein
LLFDVDFQVSPGPSVCDVLPLGLLPPASMQIELGQGCAGLALPSAGDQLDQP